MIDALEIPQVELIKAKVVEAWKYVGSFTVNVDPMLCEILGDPADCARQRPTRHAYPEQPIV